MFTSRVASLTRWFAAQVLHVHASTLNAVAAQAERQERKAWDGVYDAAAACEAAEIEAARLVRDAEQVHMVRSLDADLASKRADNVCDAVAAELNLLPYVQPKV